MYIYKEELLDVRAISIHLCRLFRHLNMVGNNNELFFGLVLSGAYEILILKGFCSWKKATYNSENFIFP